MPELNAVTGKRKDIVSIWKIILEEVTTRPAVLYRHGKAKREEDKEKRFKLDQFLTKV